MTEALRLIAAAIRRFYSWHFAVPIGGARFAIVVADSLAGLMIVGTVCVGGATILLRFYGHSVEFWLGWAIALALTSPLFAWQVIFASAGRITIVRAVLIVPYWVTKVPSGTRAQLYVADDDTDPSAVAYEVRNDHACIGNAWNARSLLDRLRKCEANMRSRTSPYRDSL